MANTFDVSPSNLDSTFVLETSEEVKQPKKENESPKMLDSNNNPPKVLATKSNLPVPTMRVLRSTPKKNIFPPGTRGSQDSQAKLESNPNGGTHWFSVLYQILTYLLILFIELKL